MKVINRPLEAEQYVYHYTRLETAAKYILPSGTVRFSPIAYVNDPREAKTWEMITTVPGPAHMAPADWDRLSRFVSDALKATAKLICLSLDRETIGTCSPVDTVLHRGFGKPSMWHHYADQHRGVCLMFDRTKLAQAFQRQIGHLGLVDRKVTYSDTGILPNLGSDPYHINLMTATNNNDIRAIASEHFRKWLPQLFFQKLTDWSNETEYRWFVFGENADPILVKFDDALEAIVVGDAVSSEDEEALLVECVRHRAEIARLQWRNGYPTISHPGQPYITHRHLLPSP